MERRKKRFARAAVGLGIMLAAAVAGYVVYGRLSLPPADRPIHIVSLELVDIPVHWRIGPDLPDVGEATRFAVPEETTQAIFRQTMPSSGWFVWKGGCLAIARMDDGTTRNIAVSYYGGVFRFEGDAGYYETLSDSRRLFDATLDQAIDKFIPRRLQKQAEEGNDESAKPE